MDKYRFSYFLIVVHSSELLSLKTPVINMDSLFNIVLYIQLIAVTAQVQSI